VLCHFKQIWAELDVMGQQFYPVHLNENERICVNHSPLKNNSLHFSYDKFELNDKLNR